MVLDPASNSERSAQPSKQTQATRRRRGRRPGLLLVFCTILYGAALLAVTIVNAAGPEKWWLGATNLYLPQLPWALPCVLLFPWYLASAWRWSWIPIALAAWVFVPIMGWSFGLARFTPQPAGFRVRVMTYNVKWGTRGPKALMGNIAAANPDVILMQDSAGALDNVLAPLKLKPGWYLERLSQYTVLSRFPISDAASLPFTSENKHTFLRCTLQVGSRKITVYDAHLMTPRFALAAIKENGAEGAGDVEINTKLRLREAAGLAESAQTEQGPLIVAGDLNSPIQSVACRTLFQSGLRDAHSESGWGYGYTYGQSTALRRPFVRIDHILVSPEWSVLTCHEGRQKGSDHSPVIADLVLPVSP